MWFLTSNLMWVSNATFYWRKKVIRVCSLMIPPGEARGQTRTGVRNRWTGNTIRTSGSARGRCFQRVYVRGRKLWSRSKCFRDPPSRKSQRIIIFISLKLFSCFRSPRGSRRTFTRSRARAVRLRRVYGSTGRLCVNYANSNSCAHERCKRTAIWLCMQWLGRGGLQAHA